MRGSQRARELGGKKERDNGDKLKFKKNELLESKLEVFLQILACIYTIGFNDEKIRIVFITQSCTVAGKAKIHVEQEIST